MSVLHPVTDTLPEQRRGGDSRDGRRRWTVSAPSWPPAWRRSRWRVAGALTGVTVLALFVRTWQIDAFGFNSDEAVYAGQAASLAGNPRYTEYFPVFRAHPMLVQTLLSPFFRVGEVDVAGRLVVVVLGVLTVLAVYPLGARLYSRRVGVIAALLLAVMPYHVVVTRQVLLDGPMVLLATLTLYCMVRFVQQRDTVWYVATAAMLGVTMLAKETSVVLAGSIYAFLALTPDVRRPVRATLLALPVLALVFATHPVSQALAGRTETGRNYLVWQLFRRPNHPMSFYLENVPSAVGLLVLLTAFGGLWWARRRRSWRETLLLSWIAVPVVFFQLWPVKGFQYLLPVVVPLAVLAARALAVLPVPARLATLRRLRSAPRARLTRVVRLAAVATVALSLLVPCWRAVSQQGGAHFLAGSGGVPGGREAGRWLTDHTPDGSVILTLGPSMSNIIRYYGQRQSYGLSVSPNPLHRNPSYVALNNPDGWLRNNNLHYIVWDSFSARRSTFFADRLNTLVRRYHGRVVHTEYVGGADASGRAVPVPVIIIYEVRP
ncbi:glycosyltransferase family 39 protein [Micromonospora humi]|uniref:Dolichyl-phosphate-mannose-protein mannosyltransferase n=1 Tax=Micromonospora humi TaxID=745366 RepID=A0A1C5HU31_9ACTN|nr:glycosyltransferase family 39 protein [Micromonospora humi]SCG49438.1 Dolichyl-phosphate-mannose-protein mannosyltransferase [Micromonospora humi]